MAALCRRPVLHNHSSTKAGSLSGCSAERISSHTYPYTCIPLGVMFFRVQNQHFWFWRCLYCRTVIRNTNKKSWIQLPDFHGISGDKASAKAPPENLGGEKQKRKTLIQNHIVFTVMNASMSQAICKCNIYANTLSTSEASKPRKYMTAEQNMDMNTHTFQSVLTQKDKLFP